MTDYLPGSIKHLNMLLGEQLTEGEGGGGSWQTVFEGSVTTEDKGDVFAGYIDQDITAETIKVTFNGVEYTCNKIDQGDDNIYYGALREGDKGADFSEYPFGLCCFPGDGTDLYTETAGTYTLKIEEPQSGGSSDFSTAVLTMTNTTENPVIFEVPCYRDGAEVLLTRAVIFGALGGEPATETINVVCKSNGATLSIASEGVTATTSGDIQYIEAEHLYIITGDCAITIS